MGVHMLCVASSRPTSTCSVPSLGSSTSLHDSGVQADKDWWDDFPSLGAPGACEPASTTERILVEDLLTDSVDWVSVSGEDAGLEFSDLPLEFFPDSNYEGDSGCLTPGVDSAEGLLAAAEPLETPPGSPDRPGAFKESHDPRTLSSAHKPTPPEAAVASLPIPQPGDSLALSCKEEQDGMAAVCTADAGPQAAELLRAESTQAGGWRGCCKSTWCTRQDKHRGVCNKAAFPKTVEQAPVTVEAGEEEEDSVPQVTFAGIASEEDLKCEGEQLGFEADEGSSGGDFFDCILPGSNCFSPELYPNFVPVDKLCSPEISECSTASGACDSAREGRKWGSEESDSDSAGDGSNQSSQEASALRGLVSADDGSLSRNEYDEISGTPCDQPSGEGAGATFRKHGAFVIGGRVPGGADPADAGNNRRRGPGRPSKLTPAASEAKAQAAAYAHKRKRSHATKAAASTGQACTNCNTHVTPVWRAGPHGPKTLCNACGVRYMKHGKKR